jgi:predicted nucleic acid-binding protein
VALILDTGPLYAMLDRRDAAHDVCRDLIEGAHERLVVPAPVLVELDYWINERLHAGVLISLLDDIIAGGLDVEALDADDHLRVRQICDRYADANVGFVDAAVLAVVERLNETKLATLDHRHFAMMRPRHVDVLALLPAQP